MNDNSASAAPTVNWNDKLATFLETHSDFLKQSISPFITDEDIEACFSEFRQEVSAPDFELTVHFMRALYYYNIGNSIWHIHFKRATQRCWLTWEGSTSDAIKQFLQGPSY